MMYLALLKRLWPFLAGAMLLLIAWRWHAAAVSHAYSEGVRVTEEAQAKVIAKVKYENEKRETELAKFVAVKQVELEGKNRETESLTAELSRVAAASQLCLRSEVRRRSVPDATGTAPVSDGSAGRSDATENLGESITGIISECQRSTDKLIVLQSFIRETR